MIKSISTFDIKHKRVLIRADLNVPINEDIQAHLLVEVDGNDMDMLFIDCEKITEVMEQYDCDEIISE